MNKAKEIIKRYFS